MSWILYRDDFKCTICGPEEEADELPDLKTYRLQGPDCCTQALEACYIIAFHFSRSTSQEPDSNAVAQTTSPYPPDNTRVKRARLGPTHPPSPSAAAPPLLTPAMTRTVSTNVNVDVSSPEIRTASAPASKTSVAHFINGNLAFVALRLFYGTDDIMRLLNKSTSSQKRTVRSGNVFVGSIFEINEASNGLSMCDTTHNWFHSLKLWLEPVYPPNWRR
jgi:hypothetical protein